MKLKFLLAFLFSIFLLSNISAAMIISGDFQDGSHSATITDGNSISFNVDFGTTSAPMILSVKMYDSSDVLIKTFDVSSYTGGISFQKTYTITKTIYQNPGTFEIILNGRNNFKDPADPILILTVNPVSPPTPTNHAPVITSTAITSVNENTAYVYDVDATDADGNTLTYSLTQNPAWLSINTNTGIISGTAPSVNSDTNYAITVRVSDGITYTEQSYTLTVHDISIPPAPINHVPVITSIPITRVDERDAYTYNVDATDADGNTLTYSLTQNPLGFAINSATGIITGTAPSVSSDADYTIIVRVSDGTDYVEQTFTLTVNNTDHNHNVSGGNGGIREIDTPKPVQKQYVGAYPTPTTVKKTTTGLSITTFFYIIISIVSLGIILIIYALVRLRGR
jgi:hypothetical protein